MKKVLSVMVIGLLIVCMISGCKKDEDKQEINANLEEGKVALTFNIYDTAEDVTVEEKVIVDSNYTIQDVVDKYRETYLSQDNIGEEYAINFPNVTAKLDGENATLSFDKILGNVGSGTEGSYIENLAQAVLDNVEEAKNIYINVNGEMYESGHIYIELDEIVKSR